jgi:chromate transporter
MGRQSIDFKELVAVFFSIGASSFGGWSTTALLLEQKLVKQRQLLSANQLKGAVSYAQILPGATQVALVSGAAYQIKGARGALVATIAYILPAVSLVVIFAFIYFKYLQTSHLTEHLSGLTAALGGIILANAYRLGRSHISKTYLWIFVAAAFAAKLWLGLNAVIILITLGTIGLLFSWRRDN